MYNKEKHFKMKTIYNYKKHELNGGICVSENGTHFAHTATQSHKYKTFKGANKWLTDNVYKLVSVD